MKASAIGGKDDKRIEVDGNQCPFVSAPEKLTEIGREVVDGLLALKRSDRFERVTCSPSNEVIVRDNPSPRVSQRWSCGMAERETRPRIGKALKNKTLPDLMTVNHASPAIDLGSTHSSAHLVATPKPPNTHLNHLTQLCTPPPKFAVPLPNPPL